MAQSNLLSSKILDIGRFVYVQDITNPEVRTVYVVYARQDNTVYLYDSQNPSTILEMNFQFHHRYGLLEPNWIIDAVVHQITGEVTWLNPITNKTELL